MQHNYQHRQKELIMEVEDKKMLNDLYVDNGKLIDLVGIVASVVYTSIAIVFLLTQKLSPWVETLFLISILSLSNTFYWKIRSIETGKKSINLMFDGEVEKSKIENDKCRKLQSFTSRCVLLGTYSCMVGIILFF